MKSILKKILMKFPSIFYKFNIQDLVFDVKWIDKITNFYLKVIKIIPKYTIERFFKIYIDQINKYIIEENCNIDSIIEKWLNSSRILTEEKKAIMFNIMYLCDLVNDKSIEALYNFLKNTRNKDYRYWMTMDMSRITFRKQKGFYPNYYIDRKDLLQKIALEHDLRVNKKSANTDEKKLCIVTFLLDDTIFNSAQRVAMMLSEGLKKYYDEIAIISLDSFKVTLKEQRGITTIVPDKGALKKSKSINKMFNENVKVFYLKEKTYEKRLQEALDYIYSYNPTAILDMSDEYSVISYYYSKDFPTYYIPMRNNISSSFFNYIVADKESYSRLNVKYKVLDDNKVKHWIFPEYVPKKHLTYTRSELGLKQDSFIITTIGNNEIIDIDLAERMNKLLLDNEDIVWLLVGNNAPDFMHRKYQQLFDSKQIIEWGFEENLAGLCAICNIHLRANNTGSSGATAIAAQQGLPIVMTNFICDPMRWLGYDYSTFTTWEEVTNEIKKLYLDNQYYTMKQNIVLDKINRATNLEEKWKELYYILSDKDKE